MYDPTPGDDRGGKWARSYARTVAKKNGWLPPLAWDDIDRDPEPPTAEPVYLDEVVVDRILAGDRLDATPAERAEVVRRWLNTGRPLADLERLTGWNGAREQEPRHKRACRLDPANIRRPRDPADHHHQPLHPPGLISRPTSRSGRSSGSGSSPTAPSRARATVALVIRLEDGSLVGAQTTLRLLNAATHALLVSPVAQMEDL